MKVLSAWIVLWFTLLVISCSSWDKQSMPNKTSTQSTAVSSSLSTLSNTGVTSLPESFTWKVTDNQPLSGVLLSSQTASTVSATWSANWKNKLVSLSKKKIEDSSNNSRWWDTFDITKIWNRLSVSHPDWELKLYATSYSLSGSADLLIVDN